MVEEQRGLGFVKLVDIPQACEVVNRHPFTLPPTWLASYLYPGALDLAHYMAGHIPGGATGAATLGEMEAQWALRLVRSHFTGLELRS